MQKNMQWQDLISDKRLGLEDYKETKNSVRSDFQRDYDRLIFSSPFRRLQNKTQVFPLPGSIFVHNRLTHSLEVAGVGRSIANEVMLQLLPRYASEPWAHRLHNIGEIVSAACLAHDLGNPPFGHSGEKGVGTRVSAGERPQLQPLLASIVKYPYSSAHANDKGKFGFFTSEHDIYTKIANELGILKKSDDYYCRHPLVYMVEAADDICYQIMDIEDAHKLKIIDTPTTISLLTGFFDEERVEHMNHVMSEIDDRNEKVAYLRSCAIGTLVAECAKAFIDNEQQILAGKFQGSLIQHISAQPRKGYDACTELAYAKIYCANDVVDIELAGNQIITFLLNRLIEAVRFPEPNYSTLLLSRVPRQYDVYADTLFGKIQAVIDHISGMTDVYALDLYRKLNGMSLPAV